MSAKNYHLHWIVGRPDIFSKYVLYIIFNFESGFHRTFLCYFQQRQLLVVKFHHWEKLELCKVIHKAKRQ